MLSEATAGSDCRGARAVAAGEVRVRMGVARAEWMQLMRREEIANGRVSIFDSA